jgi:hypothetical protein
VRYDNPPEHFAYLRRTGFAPARPEAFTAEEVALLARYGYWMEALAAGRIRPSTAEQRHFLQVVRGEAAPQSPFEHVWNKLHQGPSAAAPLRPAESPEPNGPPAPTPTEAEETRSKLEQLVEVLAYADALRRRAEAEREQILDKVRAELQAVEAKYGPQLEEATQALAELEAEVKAGVLQAGQSVRVGAVQAVFYRGRVTWDSRGLAHYAQDHPEVQQFRKVGSPGVILRYQ